MTLEHKVAQIATLTPKQTLLAPLTTLGVGGIAELWDVHTSAHLREATRAPYRILGGGSNLLIADSGVQERVIKLGSSYNDVRHFGTALADAEQTKNSYTVWLGAATPLPGLIRRATELGLSGLEGLLGVPAMLGGAIAMNAGTRYGEMSDCLEEVELFVNGGLERLPKDALNLRYRHSELPSGAIVTRARLKLRPTSPQEVRAKLAEVDKARQGQPKIKSAGCAFKNPEGDSAGRLIDHAGLKGTQVGQAMVSHEHGNFIVNLGGATAGDVMALLKHIQTHITTPLAVEWIRWGMGEPDDKHLPQAKTSLADYPSASPSSTPEARP